MLRKLVSLSNLSLPKDKFTLKKRHASHLLGTHHLWWYYSWIVAVSFVLTGMISSSDFILFLGAILFGIRCLQVALGEGGRGWHRESQLDILFGLVGSVLTGSYVEAFGAFIVSCIIAVMHATLWEEVKEVSLRHPEKKVTLAIKQGLSPKETIRVKAIQEFYDTEAKYIDYLTLTIKLFMERFTEEASKADPMITQMDVRNVFCSIPVIQNYSTALHDSLGERLDSWDNDNTKIGDIIMDLSHFMKTYQSYVTNYTRAINTLSVCQKDPRFSALVQFCEDDPRLNGEALSSLLIMPIQRLMRYVMLLQKIVELTPNDHPDFRDLTRALNCVSDIADKVNKARGEADDLNQIYRIQCKIDRNLPLLAPARRLIHESRLQKWDDVAQKFTSNYYYLFNDMMLEVKISRTLSSAHDLISTAAPKMTYGSHIYFDDSSTLRKHETIENAFVISGCTDPDSKDKEVVTYIAKPLIEPEFEKWYNFLEQCTATTRQQYTFFTSRNKKL